MRKCKFEELIDSYLLNKLSEDKKNEFEEHYFNCSSCFEKMAERDKLISMVKDERDMIFQDEHMVEEARGASWFEKIVSLLTPKQWAAAAVSACFLLLISFGLIFYVIHTPPSFHMENYDLKRGPQIIIKLTPPIDIEKVPSKIEWTKAGEDVEYEICINDNGDNLWSERTKENFIVLPEEVKSRMAFGEKYSCEVKAFYSEGRLGPSGKIQFKIQKIQ